jgi:hypothetical protein
MDSKKESTMKKVLIAGLIAVTAVAAQAQHRNPDNFYGQRAFGNHIHHYHAGSGNRVAGAVLGALVLGAVINAASQPAVVYQQAPVIVEQPPVVYQQQCQQVYVRDINGNFVPYGCR